MKFFFFIYLSCFDLYSEFMQLPYFKDRERWSFSSQKYDNMVLRLARNNMLIDYWKVNIMMNDLKSGTTVFFNSVTWWKDDIYMIFLNFPWYSRTWKGVFLVKFLILANDFPIAGPITDRNSLFISQKLRFGVFTAKFK